MNFKKMFGFSLKESVKQNTGETFIKVYISGDSETPVNERDIMVNAHCADGDELYLAKILIMISSPQFTKQVLDIAEQQFHPSLYQELLRSVNSLCQQIEKIQNEQKSRPVIRPLEVFGKNDDETLSIN